MADVGGCDAERFLVKCPERCTTALPLVGLECVVRVVCKEVARYTLRGRLYCEWVIPRGSMSYEAAIMDGKAYGDGFRFFNA